MSRGNAERLAKTLGEPHFAFHAGRNRWQVRKWVEGGTGSEVVAT